MAFGCSSTPCFTLQPWNPCSQRAQTTCLGWRTPFFRVGNGSAFAACMYLAQHSPGPWRQPAGSIAMEIINSNDFRVEVPHSFLPLPTGNPHISSVIPIYSFARQQHSADSVMNLTPAGLGAVQTLCGHIVPSLAGLMLSDMKGKHSQNPRPGTAWPQVPVPYVEFSSWSRLKEAIGIVQSDPGLSRQTRAELSVCTAQLMLLPQTKLSPGRRLLCHSGKNWDSGRSKKIPPKGKVFLLLTPKVTGNLQITHPFPGTLAGKKSRGLAIFLYTHTHKGALQRP